MIQGVNAGLIIDIPTPVVIQSIQCSASLNLSGGNLSLTRGSSVVGGRLSVSGGRTISAEGTNTTLVVQGAVSLNGGCSLAVEGGAQVRMPGLLDLATVSYGVNCKVSGTNSWLDLPGLTNVSSSSCCWLTIQALKGAVVNMTNVVSLGDGYVSVLSEGAQSRIDLANCRVASGTAYPVNFEARNGGVIWAPQLMGGPTLSVAVRDGGMMPTSQIEVMLGAIADGVVLDLSGLNNLRRGGSLALLNRGAIQTGNLTNIDGASLSVEGGSQLRLPGVLNFTNSNSSPTWQVNGTNSLLELPDLTNITSSSCCWLTIQATSGGVLNLTNVTGIGSGYISMVADGAGSRIDLSNLRSALGTIYPINLEARNRGTLWVPQFVGGPRVNAIVRSAGLLPTRQFEQLWGATADAVALDLNRLSIMSPGGGLNLANGGGLSASQLATMNGVSLSVDKGSVLSLPAVTDFGNGNATCTWQVSGSNSVLELPALTNLSSSACCWLYIQAQAGGQLRLTNLAVIASGYVSLYADGARSRIDLPQLRSALGTAYPIDLEARNGGTVWVPQLMGGPRVSVSVRSGGIVPTSQLVQLLGATADGASLDFNSLDTLGAGGTLTLVNGGLMNVAGLTNLNGASLSVGGGSVLRLPRVTTYTNQNANPTWLVSGANSELDLPGLTNLAGTGCCWSYLRAQNGGQLKLTNVTTIESGYLSILADGTNSLVDLTNLLHAYGDKYPVEMEARNGGTIRVPQLDGGPRLGITIGPGGRLPTAQLKLLFAATADRVSLDLGALMKMTEGGSLTANGNVSIKADILEDVDGVSLYAREGSGFSLPAVSNFTSAQQSVNWVATGPGSFLEFPHLTNLSGSTCCWLTVQAQSGGQLRFQELDTIASGYLSVSADGNDSRLEFPGLSRAMGDNYPINFEVRNAGVLWSPQLGGGPRLGITVRSGGTMSTAQMGQLFSVTADRNLVDLNNLTNLVPGGSITVANGGSLAASSLSQIGGVNLNVNSGSTLTLPGLQSFTNSSFGLSWSVSGAGSLLDLPELTNLSGSGGNSISAYASNGGELRMRKLESVHDGYVSLISSGAGSVVDARNLSSFIMKSGQGQIVVQGGASVLFDEDALLAANVSFSIPSGHPWMPASLSASPDLTLYGRAWKSYLVQQYDSMSTTASWIPARRVALTNTIQVLSSEPLSNTQLRVVELNADPPALDLSLASPLKAQIVLFGLTNQAYYLEENGSLKNSANVWTRQDQGTGLMTNTFRIFPAFAIPDVRKFYRAVKD